jgi:hypothetical protein
MKRSTVIWYIIGAIVLIGLGFLAGYALSGGFSPAAVQANGVRPFGMMPYLQQGPQARGMMPGFATRRFLPGFPLMGLGMGFGLLLAVIYGLGPIAGIVALILVLTRRPAGPPAPPPPVEPAPKPPKK